MKVSELRRFLASLHDNADVLANVVAAPFDDEAVELFRARVIADRLILDVEVIDDVSREIREAGES